MAFQKAVRSAKKARIGLIGPSGSGKSYTGLRLCAGLAMGGKVAAVDTERGSLSLYSGRFAFDVDADLPDFSPKTLIAKIREAEAAGYAALLIDSLSHFWMGKGGELEMVDAAKQRSKSKDGFGAWREVSPVHNELVNAILTSSMHIVTTLRVKTEYVVEQDERGRSHPKKVGLAPVQKEGMEYEFDLTGDLDGATFVVTKTRLSEAGIGLGAVFKEPGEELGEKIARWLSDAPAPAAAPQKPAVPVYEQALAFLKTAEAHRVVDEALRRAKPKVTEEEFKALEVVARQRRAALDRVASPSENPIAGSEDDDGMDDPGAPGTEHDH